MSDPYGYNASAFDNYNEELNYNNTCQNCNTINIKYDPPNQPKYDDDYSEWIYPCVTPITQFRNF